MSQDSQPAVRRVRRVSGGSDTVQFPLQDGNYRGFGSIPGETLEQFHDRMEDLDDPLEAALYKMEVALGKCPISSIEIEQGCTHEDADARDAQELSIREGMGLPLLD